MNGRRALIHAAVVGGLLLAMAPAVQAGTIRVCIRSGSATSITPQQINITANGVSVGGQNPVTPAWSIPAGNNTDCRDFTVTGLASAVNDFHMTYDASGTLKTIDIDPALQGKVYPLSVDGAYAVATSTDGVPMTSTAPLAVALLALLALGGFIAFRRSARAAA